MDAADAAAAVLDVRAGVEGLIGNTPMVRIRSLSEATGCEVYGKLEMANPGGSAKDRVALAVIEQAERDGRLVPHAGDAVFEGTSGSTGISLAMLCRAKGYRAHICLPDDTSAEKIGLLERLGAVVEKVPPASIVDRRQYVNAARAGAAAVCAAGGRAVFADQFENEANWRTHYDHTGPEIYRQAGGRVDAFVAASGTGGTISGVARYLKQVLPDVRVVLADPQGSGLFNKIKYDVMFDVREREGTRRRHQVDTIVEGVGLNRLTRNFDVGRRLVDDAERVSDAAALLMARFLVEQDGLFVGSSTAVNCVAALRVARALGPGHVVVTVLCDSGARHLSKFWAAVGPVGGTAERPEVGLDEILAK
ncbi:tryptophan synthase beta subunit-like PLP-dependent enzyme [Dipodascopsis tothii]|uniref:tryptophan synthase beta subunit-like PLP-dependent enzyme n=1 Tax=Dipodascopsis tothii TaxID=44089 RepID=UPI0034CDCB24